MKSLSIIFFSLLFSGLLACELQSADSRMKVVKELIESKAFNNPFFLAIYDNNIESMRYMLSQNSSLLSPVKKQAIHALTGSICPYTLPAWLGDGRLSSFWSLKVKA